MRVDVLHGDCRAEMGFLIDLGVQVDSVVTDPPYHLTSIVKRFGKEGSAPAKYGKDGAFARASRGFMGKEWDGGGVAFDPETWRLCFDLLKPGGHLLAFGGTRTYHRMACAVEDAGFEIRDCIQWLYGSGFPKSHNLDGEWEGWGTALKPACEPIVLARKPLVGTVARNVQQHGTGALNIDGCRVPTDAPRPARSNAESRSGLTGTGGAVTYGSYAVRGSVATGETTQGRWPANVIHDGSPEVLAAFALYGDRGAFAPVRGTEASRPAKNVYGEFARVGGAFHGDTGTAARFFYSAKASKKDRAGSKHPTVKPLALMRYLCRLVTPPGGLVLDPFAGSGTTLQAALEEGFKAIGIEREEEYLIDIRRRLAATNTLPAAPRYPSTTPLSS